MESNIILSSITIDELVNKVTESVLAAIAENKNLELNQKLISPAETTALFSPKISLSSLNRWTKQGLLKQYRVGGRLYYRQSEVLEAAKELKQYKKPF